MRIRDAELKDADRLDALLTRLIRDEARYDGNVNRACEIKDHYCRLIGMEGHKLLLAEADGEIVGYLYGFIYRVPGVYKEPGAILDALFVDEKHRRKGCASMLISGFKEFAKENGACQIELKVMSGNDRAVSLYEKLSFAEMKKHMRMEL